MDKLGKGEVGLPSFLGIGQVVDVGPGEGGRGVRVEDFEDGGAEDLACGGLRYSQFETSGWPAVWSRHPRGGAAGEGPEQQVEGKAETVQ
jgi:hypothetical protein